YSTQDAGGRSRRPLRSAGHARTCQTGGRHAGHLEQTRNRHRDRLEHRRRDRVQPGVGSPLARLAPPESRVSPVIRVMALTGLIIISRCVPAYALSPDSPLSNYIHRSWRSDSGLQTVRRMAQTPDGYLWLATTAGLVRFDGVRFTTYYRASDQSL